jgi:phosphotransferase system HPr (HPr) family protein
MPELQLTVVDSTGLHARPAARFVQVANRFTSRILLRHNEREADAKSLIALLALTLRPGSRIEISATGPDAAEALAALKAELAPYVQPLPPPDEGADRDPDQRVARPATAGLDQ